MSYPSPSCDIEHSTATAFSAKKHSKKSINLLIMTLSGLMAIVIFVVSVTQISGQSYVAVSKVFLEPGQIIDIKMLARQRVTVSDKMLERMVRYDERQQFDGRMAASQIRPNDILMKSMIKESISDPLNGR